MALIKDDRTRRLDDFELAASDALGLYADLVERIEERRLSAMLAEVTAGQSRLLKQVFDVRRELGELPQAGDPERSHLGAAGAQLRALVLPGSPTSHYVETLLEAAAGVSAALDGARTLDLDARLEALLDEFRKTNEAFEARLRRLG